ncbi:MAG TPA: 2-hydroxy-3-oxopropionate reductase [Phycisphaerae bacterium]|nr:2-hydroxy-3-oxopropionate reductase [Phycisphaerae bacterium]
METIGFIGLGLMGRPMARNLLKAGYPLVVHNRSRPPVDELAAAGASAADCPREVAERSDVVITMVPDSPDVVAVMRGPDGVFAGAREGTLLIDMSTISPVVARELAAEARRKGCEMLDAPVSGGTVGAAGGTLSIMVGGSAKAVERARPIFEVLGAAVTHVGDAGAGQVSKACNQVVVGVTIEAVGEALVLAEKCGVDPAKVREALLGGFAQSRILDVHGQRALDRNFEPGFKAAMQLKDLAIARAAGREYGAALPATDVVAELYESVCAAGAGEADHSVLMAHVARLAGLEWRSLGG